MVVHKILAHLGLPTECPQPLPARPPPAAPPAGRSARGEAKLPFPDF